MEKAKWIVLFICYSLVLSAGLMTAESNVFHRYYAMMEKRKQLNDLNRNSVLISMQPLEKFDTLIESVSKQYELIKMELEKSGGENFKSCNDINNQRLNTYGRAKLEDGIYLIFVSGKVVPVFCDMTSLGGGFTLVRRVSTVETWWPLNDNFSGIGYGIYDPNLAFVPNVVFGIDYSTIPRSKFLFKTGDRIHWLMVSEKYLKEEFTEEDTCTKSVPILASSKYGDVKYANWCARKNRPEDPWISFDDHMLSGDKDTDGETHSMLWGENNVNGWKYWKNHHNGVNVFIK